MLRILSFGMVLLGFCNMATAQQNAPTPVSPSTDSALPAPPATDGTANPPEPARSALGVMLADDMTINRVEAGSPAAQMGLQRGDRLNSLNGEPFSSADAFIDRISRLPVNQDVQIAFDRNGEQMKQTGRLGGWQQVFPGDTAPQKDSSTRPYNAGIMNGMSNSQPTYRGFRNNSGQIRPTRFLYGYGYGRSGLGWVNNCTPMYAGSYYMNCDPGFCNYCYSW